MSKVKRRTMGELEEAAAGSKGALARQRALEEMLARVQASKRRVSVKFPSKNRLKFGVIADTHFGSTEERVDALEVYYANAEKRGITTILHAGDVLAGHKIYKGQEFEVHQLGWHNQLEWFRKSAPRHKGMKTIFIVGNHDTSFKHLAGVDPGTAMAAVRDDWEYIGEYVGEVIMETADGREFKVQLLHPGGGTTYAISYRTQKIIESLAGGDKPHMLVIGHLHKMELLPNYRNVVGVQAGCFEDQTSLLKRSASQAMVGGWFFEVDFFGEEELQMQVKPEFLTFY